ncbi:MAG: DUF4238 domain-containing protein [Yonghaparkia sp.]|nr:DUF4238 domain-containing protein [Microcella sp.]
MKDPYKPISERVSFARAREWLDKVDHGARVGKKHHIVPRWVLDNFANEKSQVSVRDRNSGEHSLRSVNDLAITDFYTTVDVDGNLNSQMEDLLGVIESAALDVVRRELAGLSFRRSHEISSDDRLALDGFVAMQKVRGMRTRRSLELLTDWQLKFLNQGKLTVEEINGLEFIPHQNEHIRMMNSLVDRIAGHLSRRPASLLKLDRPLLVISDEPVVLRHEQSDSRTRAAKADGLPLPNGQDQNPANIVSLTSNSAGGLAMADDIGYPIGPDMVIYYGTGWRLPAVVSLDRAESNLVASWLNEEVLANAVGWVAANPAHRNFKGFHFPPPRPILRVFDGGSEPSKVLNRNSRFTPQRFRKPDTPLGFERGER